MLNAFWHIKLKIIDKGFVIHVDMDGTNILKIHVKEYNM